MERVDRGGTFLGSITTKAARPLDLGKELLIRGLAKLHAGLGGRDLAAAEQEAQDKRIGVRCLSNSLLSTTVNRQLTYVGSGDLGIPKRTLVSCKNRVVAQGSMLAFAQII